MLLVMVAVFCVPELSVRVSVTVPLVVLAVYVVDAPVRLLIDPFVELRAHE